MSKKKQSLGSKIKHLPKTISGYYKKDENGKTNRVASTVCTFTLLSPLVLIEGIKLGFYAKYNDVSPALVFLNGLTTSFINVLRMKDQAAEVGFGTYNGSFKIVYLEVFILAYGIIFASSFISAERNKDKDNKKDGDMKFANIDEFNEQMAVCDDMGEPYDPPEDDYNPGNMILSNRVRYALEPSGTNTYSCALIVGATGCGKSYTYAKPNILQMNSSYIITDPKGELTSDLGLALMKNGYNIKIFNVNEPEFSCKYNPFHYIRNEEDVISAVNVFLDNTKEQDSGSSDPFFPLAEKNFYLALFFYIYTVYKDEPEKQTFKTIYEIYQKANEPETQLKKGEQIPDSPFDVVFKQLAKDDPSNPALQYYATFKKGSNKTKQSILISVGVKLWFMGVPSIANMMSDDTLELDKIGDRKTAVFVIIPSEKKTFRFLSAMLFTQMFETLYYVGNTLNEKSWILKKGSCIALRSKPFIAGTQSEIDAKEDLISLQAKYKQARIEDDNELIESDPAIRTKFDTADEYGIKPFPMVRLIYKNDKGEDEVLEEFQSRKACERVLDAAINGQIAPGTKEHANHIRFMLDEFYNIGVIPDFDMKIATFRSLRMSADIIIQSVAQIKEMYQDRESKITNNCSIQILLGAGSLEDCQYFSDLIGQTTVKSESMSLNHKGIIPGVDNINLSDGAKLLLRPEQIRIMNKDKCLIVVATKMPIQDQKYEAHKHPHWDETFSSHDLDKTIANRFEFRRVFRIKQEEKNKIVTVLINDTPPKDIASSSNNAIGTKNMGPKRTPMIGMDPDAIVEEPKGRPMLSPDVNKIGINNKRTIEDTNADYEKQILKMRDINTSGGEVIDTMDAVTKDKGSSAMFTFKGFGKGSIEPKDEPEIKTLPRFVDNNHKIKESQIVFNTADDDVFSFD